MGWDSWNKFHCNPGPTDALIRQTADAMVSSGMAAAGYRYVVIDDCWSLAARDGAGNLQVDMTRFPNGMRAVADYVHSKGLKFGIYASIGTSTCTGHTAGSMDHETEDVRLFASFGVDYIKADRCNVPTTAVLHELFGRWPAAVAAAGRPMVLSASDNGGPDNPWAWGPTAANQWRTTGDIQDNWPRMLTCLDGNSRFPGATVPGGFNDPDMLEVGNGGMTDTEYRAHAGMWALQSAPLIAGNDLRSMTAATIAILTHNEVIAIDQDPLSFQAIKASDNGAGLQVWYKPVRDSGVRAVGLLNRSDAAATMSVTFAQIGLASGAATVRDVWARANLGTFNNSFSTTVPSHGIALLRIVGRDMPLASGFISDQPAAYVTSGFGPISLDRSNGGTGANDGATITLNGTSFAKGLGVHAPSSIDLRPNGRCSSFSASVGVDDEVGSNGSVIFQVWGDGKLLFSSGVMTGSSPTQDINVNITGRTDVRLAVAGGTDTMNSDHADWANARVTCGASSIEAEGNGNTFAGSVAVAACAACSGGQKVRFIGNSPANFVTFNNVNVGSAGSFQLQIDYTVDGARSFFVSVNDGAPVEVAVTGTSFAVPATTSTTVRLNAGANTIKIFNAAAFAPDLDRIMVIPAALD
jgi:alpha-galactosidase